MLKCTAQLRPFLQKIPKSSRKLKVVYTPCDSRSFQRCAVHAMSGAGTQNNLKTKKSLWAKRAYELGVEMGCLGNVTPKDIEVFCFLHSDWGVTIFSDLQTVKARFYPERSKTVFVLWQPLTSVSDEDAVQSRMLLYEDLSEDAVYEAYDRFCEFHSYTPKEVTPVKDMSEFAYSDDIPHFDEGHFHVVLDPNTFDREKKFCNRCARFLNKWQYQKHRCLNISDPCLSCGQRWDTNSEWFEHRRLPPITCQTCKFICYGEDCLARHARLCTSRLSRCQKCKAVIDHYRRSPDTPHVCGEQQLCKTCNQPYEKKKDHRCYIMRRKPPALVEQCFWAFDFETDPTGTAQEVICVAWVRIGESNEENMYYAAGENCLREFATFIVEIQKQKIRTRRGLHVWVAHNGAGFDFHLLRQPLAEAMGKQPQVTENGTRLQTMGYPRKISFIDSANHFKIRLCDAPKTFSFDCFLSKNGIRCGSNVYTPTMSSEELQPLRDTLCFSEEQTYASMRSILEAENAGNKGYFPYMFVQPGYKGDVPDITNFSTASMDDDEYHGKFLPWYEAKGKEPFYDYDKELREYCILDVKILNRAVFNYQRKMTEISKCNPMTDVTLASFCLRVFLTHHIPLLDDDSGRSILPVLKPDEDQYVRRGMNGGRTDSYNTYVYLTDAQLREGYEICYFDIISMYPHVQNSETFPTGEPFWLTDRQLQQGRRSGRFETWNQYILSLPYEGYLEIDVEPNRMDLYPPFPTSTANGKVNWTCHPIEKDVYALPEIRDGIKTGAVVTKVHSALLFKGRSDQLFKSYIQTFYTLKTLASKRPKGDLQDFCDRAKRLHGLDLDPSKFEPNSSLKTCGKNIVNSLWGKLAQRCYNRIVICSLKDFLHKYLPQNDRGQIEILSEEDIDGETIKMVLKGNDDETLDRKSCQVAAYVTSYARVILRKLMQTCGSTLIGGDTDSVWWLRHKKHGPHLEEGDQLGELENEKPNYLIYSAVSTGAKCYAFLAVLRGHELPHHAMTTYTYLIMCTTLRNETCDVNCEGCPNCARLYVGPEGQDKKKSYIRHVEYTRGLLPYNRILEFINIHVRDLVKAKGVNLKNKFNKGAVTFHSLKELVFHRKRQIKNLNGSLMKRRRLNGVHTVIEANAETKALSFTADKRVPPLLEYQHMYPSGYLLPQGHLHAEI